MADDRTNKAFDEDRENDDIPESDGITEEDLGVRAAPDTAAGQPSPEQPADAYRDTFFGPPDKRYLDVLNRRMTKLRGSNVYYYVLRSQTERTDDILPVTENRIAGPHDQTRHAGGGKPEMLEDTSQLSALWGEPILVGHKISTVEREYTPSWDFDEPILVRGVLYDPERAETPDGRGAIYTKRIRLSLARILCETEWNIRPRVGDMVRIPNLANPPRDQDNYYDVEEVVINDTRFGGTGFFTAFTMQLSRSSRHAPQRKIPEKDKRDAPDPPV